LSALHIHGGETRTREAITFEVSVATPALRDTCRVCCAGAWRVR